MNSILLYLLPALAILLSFFFVVLTNTTDKKKYGLLLAFSGAFLLALIIFHLLPHVFDGLNDKLIGLCIIIGILLQIVLEFFSKGAEHGHVHPSSNSTIPWMLLISLGIHSFLEGTALKPDESLIYGIVIHKIPVAIILSIFLLNTAQTIWKPLLFMTVFALMTPLGTFAVNYIPLLRDLETPIMAIVIGILLHISTVIIFESSDGHKFNLGKITAILLGVAIAYFL